MINEKIFSDVKVFGLFFMPLNWIICLIVSIILFFVASEEVLFGYLLGSLTSYLAFGLMMKNSSNLTSGNKSFKKQVMSGFFVRSLLSAAILGFACFDARFDILATLIGMLVLRVLLIIFVFIITKILNKKEVETNETPTIE